MQPTIHRATATRPPPNSPNPKQIPSENNMNVKTRFLALALGAALLTSGVAHAQGASTALSAASSLPIASVVVGAAGTSTAIGASAASTAAASTAVVAVPAALAVSGAVLVVKTVEASAVGTAYLLERASDGARASVEVAHKAAGGASLAVGTSVVVTTVASGVILSAAGVAIAFIPNTLGKALLHNERVAH
jgi:hypothetical protein